MRRALLAASLLCALAAPSRAEPTGLQLQVGGTSYHFDQRPDGRSWNQVNWGAGLQYVFSRPVARGWLWPSVTGGVIRNSERGWTTYVAAGVRHQFITTRVADLHFGMQAGVMNYPSEYDEDQGFFVVAIPILSACAHETAYCLDTMILPKVQERQQSGALLFQLRVPLSRP